MWQKRGKLTLFCLKFSGVDHQNDFCSIHCSNIWWITWNPDKSHFMPIFLQNILRMTAAVVPMIDVVARMGEHTCLLSALTTRPKKWLEGLINFILINNHLTEFSKNDFDCCLCSHDWWCGKNRANAHCVKARLVMKKNLFWNCGKKGNLRYWGLHCKFTGHVRLLSKSHKLPSCDNSLRITLKLYWDLHWGFHCGWQKATLVVGENITIRVFISTHNFLTIFS